MNAGNGAFKQHPVLIIIVADQKTGPDPEARYLADLLSDPSITRRTGDGEMDHASRAMFDNEKQE